jgi:hypothetical protein
MSALARASLLRHPDGAGRGALTTRAGSRTLEDASTSIEIAKRPPASLSPRCRCAAAPDRQRVLGPRAESQVLEVAELCARIVAHFSPRSIAHVQKPIRSLVRVDETEGSASSGHQEN